MAETAPTAEQLSDVAAAEQPKPETKPEAEPQVAADPDVVIPVGTPAYRLASALGTGDSPEVLVMAGDVADVIAGFSERERSGKAIAPIFKKVEQLKPGVSLSLSAAEVQKLVSAVKKAMA